MKELLNEKCIPCSIGAPVLTPEIIEELMPQLDSDWKIHEGKELERTFRFPDFKTGLDFVNQVGLIAEAQGHHPDICLSWGKVVIRQMTHKIQGLHENDFIMAAKFDALYPNNR